MKLGMKTSSIAIFALALTGCTTLEGVWADLSKGKSETKTTEISDTLSDHEVQELVEATALWGDDIQDVEMDKLVEPVAAPAVYYPNGEIEIFPVSVEDAHKQARVEPGGSDYLGALQVYPFRRGSVFQVYTVPEQVTDIALEPGEELISVSAGDTSRWMVGDTRSGAGANVQAHILVKPLQADISTNLVVLTSKRTYYMELHARESGYMAGVSWSYSDGLRPAGDLGLMQVSAKPLPQLRGISGSAYETVPDIEVLNFSYKIKGDHPDWRPVRAFDDGRKVYIQFPLTIGRSEAPPLFVKSGGETALVNYRVKGRYYVVDRLFDEAELRLGEKNQQVVRILKKDVS